MISSLLLTLGFVYKFFFSYTRCKLRLFEIFLLGLYHWKLLRTASAGSHGFGSLCLLDVIHTLHKRHGNTAVAIKDITELFITRYGKDYQRPLTAKLIGSLLRRRLNIQAHKSGGVFVIPIEEQSRLNWLYQKYGIADQETNTTVPAKHEPKDDAQETNGTRGT